MDYFKRQSLHSRLIGDQSVTLTADGEVLIEPAGGKVKIDGDLVVTGNASGPEATDILYVTQDGNDLNDGKSLGPDGAKATIKSAVEAAQSGTTILVGPGDFFEENPIVLPDFVTIRGTGDLRNTRVFPRNNTQTIFYVGNGCYIHELTMRGLRYPGWCVEIREGALVTTSPYVQNCTNMNGPWLNDGTEFIPFETIQIPGVEPGAKPIMVEDNPSLPFSKQVNNTGGGGGMYVDGNKYDPASLVFSMVADAFTQISQGGIGFWIDNFGYTQIVSCFSVFCSVGFKTTRGGYLSISNSVSDFGLVGIEADGFFPQAYTTARPQQDYYSTVASVTINTPGANYASAPTVSIEAPSKPGGTTATATASIDTTSGRLAAVTIQDAGSGYTSVPLISFSGGGATAQATGTVNLASNVSVRLNSLRDKPQTGSIIKFDGDPLYYYITGTNQINPPFVYDEQVCRRDLSRIIDAVTADIVLGTEYQSQAAATSYLRATSSKVLSDQLAPTVYGIEQARDLMKAETSNLAMEEQIDYLFNIITATINDGDSSVQPNNTNSLAGAFNDLQTIDPARIIAKDNVIENREFLVEEVVAYINDQFTELSYNQADYKRDMTTLINGIQMFAVLESNQQIIRIAQEYEYRDRYKNLLLSSFRFLSEKFEALAEVQASSIALQNVKEGFNQFMNIVDDGDSSANVIVFPEHAGVDDNRADAKDQLQANKNFMLEEFTTFLSAEAPGFVYDEDDYKLDFERIIDAMTFDVLYNGNSSTVTECKYYFANGAGGTQFSDLTPNDRNAVVATYARMRFVIARVVRGLSVTPTSGNGVAQDFGSNNATQSEASFLDSLLFNVEDMIDNVTLTRLPATLTYPTYGDEPALQIDAANIIAARRDGFINDAIQYNLANNPTLTYDVEKCKRDVGYIVDAINRDILLGTNHNSIQAGQAYKRANVAYLNVEQKPATILSLKYAKTLGVAAVTNNATIQSAVADRWDIVLDIIEFDQLPSQGIEYPDPGPASNELIYGVDQVLANKAFLQEEVVAYIANNYYVYDEDKCSRDTGLIIDAAAFDTLLGTNYNAVTAGLSYQRANSAYVLSNQNTETIAGINFAKSRSSDATTHSPSQSDVEAAFDEVIDIIQNGAVSTPQAADPLTFTDPTNATTGEVNAKAQLQNNRDFIAAETVAYINENYVNFSYDSAKCERDIGLILDAVSKDIALGTNYNAVTAGLGYSRAGAATNKQAQGVQTLESFKFARKETVEKGLSDIGEARALAAWNEVIDIFVNGIQSTDTAADTLVFTNPVGANQDVIDAKDRLIANREFIAQETLAFVNDNKTNFDVSGATYNQATGDMVLTIGSHSLTTSDTITLKPESLAFSCTYGQGNHTYVGGTATAAVQSGGNYTHTFVSAVTNGVTSNLGNLPNAVTGATYNAATGEMVITSTAHSLTTSNTLSIADDALTFTCTMDGNSSNHTYPRSTDPASGANLAISSVTADTITINVGASPIVNHDVTDATYNYATGVIEMTIGSHSLTVGTSIKIANDSLTFTCDADGNATQHTYPRATDPARDTALTITAVTGTTVSVNVGIIDASTSSTKSYPRASSNDPAYNTELAISAVDATTITVNVGPNTTNPTVHTFESAVSGAVITQGYNQDKCLRDTRYIVDGLTHDILYGGNSATRVTAASYFEGAAAQLPVDQLAPTTAAYEHLKNNVLPAVVTNTPLTPTTGNTTPQDTTGGAATATESAALATLVDIIIDHINGYDNINPLGDEVLPSVTWASAELQQDYSTIIAQKSSIQTLTTAFIADTFTGFNFNSTKCDRDTKYIVDALTYDILYGGNSATVGAARSYWVGTQTQVEGQKAETAKALEYTATILNKIIQDQAVDYTWQSGEAQNTSAGAGTATEAARASNLLQIIQDVITDGLDQLPAEIKPDYPQWVSTDVVDGVSNLLAEKATIQADTVSFINTTYNGFSYSEEVCKRDTGFIIDAVVHDAFYEANISTLIATRAYFLGTTQYLPNEQVTPTVQAYTHLQSVIDDTIQGVAVTPQTGNPLTQTLSGNYGDAAVATTFTDLIGILKTAVQNQTLIGTPAEIEPNYTWIAEANRNAASEFFVQKSYYQDETITYINENILGFSYNIDKCKRDTGYILDAALYDMMYGGDKQSRRAALAYYNGAILTGIAGAYGDQTGITAYANKYLADIVNKVSKNEVVTRSFGNTATQTLTIPDGSTLLDSSEFPGAELALLINRVADAIEAKSMGDWFEREHDLTLGNSIFLAERNAILAEEQSIIDTSISNLNLVYGGIFDITVFPGVISVTTDKIANLNNVSTVSTSGHAFEYVGAGVTYNALPFFGGTAIPETEIVESNQGKIFAGGTVDQIGNFRVGNFFAVNALTGGISLNANEIDLEGLTSVGPFIRNGIPVGVELKEVSDNEALLSSLGTQDFQTAPTQRAVATYVESRYLNKTTGGDIVGDVSMTGDLAVNGDAITSTSASFEFLNSGVQSIDMLAAATTINIGATTGTVTINPDVTIEGVLTVNGNLVFDGDVNISIPDETLQAYSITEGTEDYVSINTRNTEESITFGTAPKVIIANQTESTSKDTGALVVDGGVGIEGSTFIETNLTVNANANLGSDRTTDEHTVAGKIDIDIPDDSINNFRIHENISEYVNIYTTDGAEQILLGATPKLIVLNNTNATDNTTGAVQVTGGISAQQNIHSGIDIVADRDLIADRNAKINGSNITTDSTTFDVINTVATTVNAFGDATTLNIGGATGTMTIGNEVVIIDSVAGLQIPVGTTADRPTNVTGRIRFNTSLNAFEGYDGIAWNTLGGVIDVDQDTKVVAEDSPGADNDELDFFTGGTLRATLSNTEFNIQSTVITNLLNDTQSDNYTTGALVVAGGVGIAKNLHVNGYLNGNNSGVLTIGNLGSDKIIIKGETIETPDTITLIANAPDSAADDVVYPMTFAHHTVSGAIVAGAGTGIKFELETTNNNFEIGGQIETVAQDITGSQEDFDMVFRTMDAGTAGVEKLRLSETTSTFSTNVQVDQNLFVTGILDAAGFRGSIFADDSTEMIDAINNKITVTDIAAGTLSLTTDLEVIHGGTGVSTLTEDGIMYGAGTGAVQVTAAAGDADASETFQVLTVTSDSDATPIWSDTIDGGTF